MDEYVKVTFPTRRQVWVDGKPAGFTNKIFQVETGNHVFDLGPKKNYKPERQERAVQGTMPEEPMIVAFERVDDK